MTRLIQAILIVCTGCTTFQQGVQPVPPAQPLYRFPQRSELMQMQRTPAPERVLQHDVARADGWIPSEAPAELLGDPPYEDGSPWAQPLAALIQSRAQEVHASASLRCLAEEMGRFYLNKGAMPGPEQQRFLTARCGCTVPQAHVAWSVGTAATAVKDEALWQHWQDGVTRFVNRAVPAGEQRVGQWFGREASRAILVLASGRPLVDVEPLPTAPDADGKLTVRGVLRLDAVHVEGLINQGRYGVVECTRDPRVTLPRFALSCPMAEADPVSWMSIVAQPRGRALAQEVLAVLAHKPGSDLRSIAVPPSEPVPVRDAAAFTDAALAGINRARAEAGLKGLVLAPAQSKTAADLSRQFFAVQFGTLDPAGEDRIALGLMAGWDVEGTVRRGNLLATLVAPTQDVGEWLADALGRPQGRRVLLQQDAHSIAIGPLVSSEPHALGAVVTVYSLFTGSDHTPETQQVMGQIAAQFRQRGLPAPAFAGDLSDLLKREAASVPQGAAPRAALQRMLNALAARHHQGRVFVVQATGLDELPLPATLFGSGRAILGVTVTHHKPDGAAWAHYVVFLVLLDPGLEA